jgi:hypothetical protein
MDTCLYGFIDVMLPEYERGSTVWILEISDPPALLARRVPRLEAARAGSLFQSFTSKRRTADHAPAIPPASFARIRHHMRIVGSVLVVNCEVLTVLSIVIGAENVSASSIWIV